MNVCILGDARSPHVHGVCRGLIDRGWTVHVVWHKIALIAGATVERFEVPPPGLRNPRRWAGRRRAYLRNLLRTFDVVNVQFLHDWGWTPEIVADGCFVATPWGSDIVYPPGETSPLVSLQKSRKALLQHAAVVTALGPSFACAIASFGDINPSDIRIAPFGVDIELFRPAGESKRIPPGDEFRVGYFKGFRAVYDPETLIRALPIILYSCPRTRFELIGDGPRLHDCRMLAIELNVDHAIDWKPYQTQAGVARLLRNWDVSVITSVHESLGVAALESSACAVPVVATDVDGLRDTVREDINGVRVPCGDFNAVAEAVVALLKDPQRRRELGERARVWAVERYRREVVAGQWIEAFEAANAARLAWV